MMFKRITLFICVLCSIKIYSQTTTGEWITKANMPTARTQGHAIDVGNKIYVIGGDNSGAIEVYTPSENTWEKKKSFPGHELNWSGAGLIGDDIYAVIGIGSRDNTKYHVIAKYNIKQDEWTRIDSTNTPVNDPGVAIAGNSIYIISGFIKGKNSLNSNIPLTNIDTVKEYNLITRKWSIKAGIPTKRHAPWVAVIDSLIYVFGGVDETFSVPPSKVVEVYDPKNNSWSSKNNMRDGMAYFRGARIGNRIYFSDGRIRTIALYDIDYDTWTNEQAIPYNGLHWASAALNNVVYIFGGSVYQNKTETILQSTYAYVPKGMVKDFDGNVYGIVKIGDQVWMRENLNVTHYNNGDAIPEVSNSSAWAGLTTGAFCNFNNNSNYAFTYGKLYNYYTIADDRKLCPSGWHVASDDEWKTLEMYLGMSHTDADAIGWRGTNQSGKLKETGTSHWHNPNSDATNETGFSALPGGGRNESGEFVLIQDLGYWWTSTALNADSAWRRDMGYSYTFIDRNSRNKKRGLSIRCIKDNITGLNDKNEVLEKDKSFSLSQNYPNPFNPETVINYSLSAESHVELEVFDSLGHEVTTLVNKKQPAGNYQIEFDGKKLSSGIYFYKIKAGDFVKTNKMILMR